MKYPPASLTPFFTSPPQNSRLFPRHGSPLPTDHSTHNPSAFCSPLFSRTYELLPPRHRFASHAFSSTYKSLCSQLPCFQKHLRCPLVFSKSIQIAHGVTPPNSGASSMVSVPSAFSVLNSFPLERNQTNPPPRAPPLP